MMVTVVVLSKQHPDRLTVEECTLKGLSIASLRATPEGVEACDGKRRCLTEPEIELSCPGGARIRAPSLPVRTYGESLRVTLDAGALRVVSRIEIERYVAGVVDAEMPGAPEEAKRALAIVVRTFAQVARRAPRHEDADLCDLTHCQVLRSAQLDASLAATAGRILALGGGPAPVFFHSTCGGRTRDAREVWPDLRGTALPGVSDLDPAGQPYCRKSPHARWISELGEQTLARALEPLAGRPLHAPSLELALSANGDTFTIQDRSGPFTVLAERVHLTLGRTLGFGRVKSASFVADRAGDTFRLRGRGLGHGVGLCQMGAIERARRGATAEEILHAYFPSLEVRAE